MHRKRRQQQIIMDQFERMCAGMAYIADGSLYDRQRACRRILHRLNTAPADDFALQREIVRELLPDAENACIIPPFHCDYGTRIHAGKNLYINYNCTILDVGGVTIGDNCMFGPNVSLFAAGHPLHPVPRSAMYEYGKPISIGDQVWLGGGTTVLPGVRIGSNAVIGAGSVVTHDIPAWSLAAGNPCRVLRRITEADKPCLYRDEPFDSAAWQGVLRYEEGLRRKPKIAVLGFSGSGKSTLAQALAARWDVPLLHLDRVFWLPGWQERPREESRRMIRAFLDAHDGWVIDGNYQHPEYLYARRMAEADRILLLRFNRFSCFGRALKRAVQCRGQVRDSIGEGCPEKFDLGFAKWILHDGRTVKQQARHDALQKQYAEKLTIIKDQRGLDAFYQAEGLERGDKDGRKTV